MERSSMKGTLTKGTRFFRVAAVLFALPLLAVPQMVRAEGDGKAGPHEAGKEHHVFSGQFTAVDAGNSSLTLTSKNGETRVVTITADTKIEVNGKAGAVADIQVGMYGGVKLAADGKTALMLRANTPVKQHIIFGGHFTAVNAAQSSVTLTTKQGETKTITIGPDTKIEVNGKAGTLADVQVGMYGGVKFNEDGKTVLMLRAQSPR